MTTQEISGHEYRIGKLDAFEQLHVARKLGPAFSKLIEAFRKNPEAAESGDIFALATEPLMETFAEMSKEDVEYIVNTCIATCERKQDRGYAKVAVNGNVMFQDIEVDGLIGLTLAVVQENLGRFFPTSQPESDTPQ